MPESIRIRPGFAAGLATAAQRILDTDPKGSLRTLAVVTLLDSLHQQADLENDLDADKQLDELVTKYSGDADKKIAAEAALFALEQRVLKADELDLAKLPPLLDEVHTALKKAKHSTHGTCESLLPRFTRSIVLLTKRKLATA